MQNGTRPEAILIAGPTASGKSGLALLIARALGGAVVNADSMQVYDRLSILTARPSDAEMDGVPHLLYGHRSPEEPYSVGLWRREVAGLLPRLAAEDRVPVFCGGTGLYFRALVEGLDAAPTVPAAIRERWRERMAAEGPARLHALLADVDPVAAGRVRPSDPQRIVRALELFEARSTNPREAEGEGAGPLLDEARCLKIVLDPPREILRERIARRFDGMLEAGAQAEALAFARRPGALEGLAGKAIGVAELLAATAGEITLETALQRSITRTRQYAKRQETWFRNQFGPGWMRVADPAEIDTGRLPGRACSDPAPVVEIAGPRQKP